MEAMQKTGATYLQDMISFDSVDEYQEPSEIAQFFSGKKVLITGGSGFLGRLLIEKVLRSCPDIRTLYLIMRPKKGLTATERFNSLFDDPLYDRLKKEVPNFRSKIVMVEGDTAKEDLGLSEENRKLVLDTNVIFHAAATVGFDETIRVATNINIRGTKQLLLLAKEMPDMKAFVHISTAFCHCVLKYIEEKFYEPPLTPDDLIKLTEVLDDEALALLQPKLVGEFPNTYAFSKAIAEDVVRTYSEEIPTCIVRPSIVLSTARDPMTAWTNNLYGATGILVGAGLGLLRTLHCTGKSLSETIPADYVIPAIIAAAWDTAVNGKVRSKIKDSKPEVEIPDAERIPIYNNVSSCQNPITWEKFMALNAHNGIQCPSMHTFWIYFFHLHENWWVDFMCKVLFHLFPALLVDILLIVTFRKPRMLKIYKKIHKFSRVIAYFSTQEWRFHNDNILKLLSKMNKTDRQIFNFDLTTLDWEEYYITVIRGLRVFIAKDPMDSLEAAKIRYKKLKIAHNILVTVVCLLFAWMIYSIVQYTGLPSLWQGNNN